METTRTYKREDLFNRDCGRWERFARLTCACVLLIAVMGKIAKITTSTSLSTVAVLVGQRGEVAIILFELVLAIAFMIDGRAFWKLAGVIFFAFGILFHSFLFFVGQATCGCLGAIDVHPIWVTLLDMVCLGLLVRSGLSWRISKPSPIESVVLVFSFLLIGCITFDLFPGGFLSRVRGEAIVVPMLAADSGRGFVGTTKVVNLALFNISDRPVTILGSNNTCECRLVEASKLTIPANENRTIRVEVSFGKSAGLILRTFDLLTSDSQQPVVRLRIFGLSQNRKQVQGTARAGQSHF